MIKRLLTTTIAVAALGTMLATEVFAQANPNFLVNTRRGAMQLQGKYFFPVLSMAMGSAPYDAAVAQRNADYLAVLSQLPWDDFQQRTVGATAPSKAKEEIYKDAAKFKASADTLQAEIRKLGAAAKAGDQAAFGAAAKAVGGACNSCHEAFSTYEFRFKVQ